MAILVSQELVDDGSSSRQKGNSRPLTHCRLKSPRFSPRCSSHCLLPFASSTFSSGPRVLQTWSPVSGAIEGQWNLGQVGLSVIKVGHWQHAFERNMGNPPPPISLSPGHSKMNKPLLPHVPTRRSDRVSQVLMHTSQLSVSVFIASTVSSFPSFPNTAEAVCMDQQQ